AEHTLGVSSDGVVVFTQNQPYPLVDRTQNNRTRNKSEYRSPAIAHFNEEGLRYLLSGNFDGAINEFTARIGVNQALHGRNVAGEAVWFNNRGVSYFARGRVDDYESALADFDRAIELDSALPAAYHNRGNLRYFFGSESGAVADFAKANLLDG